MAKKEKSRIYLFQGRDDYSKTKAVEELLREVTDPDFELFDRDEMTGDSATASRIITGAGILPLGSPKRTVLVRYAHKMPAAEQAELARNLYMVPESGCIILWIPAPDMKDGKPAPGFELSAGLSKAIEKEKGIRKFEPVTRKKDIQEQVEPFVRERFREQGKEIGREALELLIRRVGTDYTLLASETDKLCAYALDQKTVTPDDVRQCTSETPEERVFEFLDALLGREGKKAVAMAEGLFIEGNEPQATALKLLSLLSGQLRLLWQARILTEQHPDGGRKPVSKEDLGDLAEYFPPGSLVTRASWQQTKLLNMARKTTFAALRRWIGIVADTDLALKGAEDTDEEPEAIIKTMVLRMVI
ncbi:MAG: DNA polymerase III subunit delta [Abditibacteriota bacterium]|nr:DNA polymerase III subunit delta [Abditibacteriota bacterium]